MWPKIGEIKTYTIVYSLAMISQMALAIWYCRRKKLPTRYGIALGGAFLWGMVAGAHILYDLRNHQFDWRNYLDVAYYFCPGMWGGPLAYLIVAVLGVMLVAERRRDLIDVIALSLPVPLLIAKVACFVNGCCYGAPCGLPWAVTFPGGGERVAPPGIARHPTQLYEVLGLSIIAVAVFFLDRPRRRGRLLVWFLLFYGVMRPVTEVFRADYSRTGGAGPFTSSQIVCLGGAMLAAVALVRMRQRPGEAEEPALL